MIKLIIEKATSKWQYNKYHNNSDLLRLIDMAKIDKKYGYYSLLVVNDIIAIEFE